MPKYYFNVASEAHFMSDEEGTELPSHEAARKEANEIGREMLAAALLAHEVIGNNQIIVTDRSGSVLLALKIRDTLE